VESPSNPDSFVRGYETAIDEVIRLIDAMRGPKSSALSAPILLHLRAELIAMRTEPAVRAA